LSSQDNNRWREGLRALDDVIREHIRKEEDVEFPALESMLDERRITKISALIRREEALIV
jgi:hemerythrin-like domain-containing protein